MKKRLLLFLFVAVLLVFTAGCGTATGGAEDPSAAAEGEGSPDAEAATITIVDHNGDTVTLPKEIDRIVVTDIYPLPSVLSVFFGSAEKIVGIADTSMSAAEAGLLGQLYPEILTAETGFFNNGEVNVEELMRLDPDVVFYNASSSSIGDALRAADFNAVAISVNKWDYDAILTLQNWIDLLSEMFPENDKADLVRTYSDDVYQMIQARVAEIPDKDKTTLFWLFQYSDSMLTTSGQQFFGEWWSTAVGAKNVGHELSQDNSVAVSLEQIYTWNPDKIFMTNFNPYQPADLYNNTVGNYDWSGIAAVQNEQAYKMPLGMYRSYTPGVDTPMTLLWLAKTVYPDLFTDIDINAEVRDYYQTLFGIQLTDEQIALIFAPSIESAPNSSVL